MTKTLTLGKPKLWLDSGRVYSVKWDLLDEDRKGYRISWIEKAFDTLKPECMAFPVKYDKNGIYQANYREKAVSYNPDAALALDEVLTQLRETHGYTYNTEVEVQLLPGEVVADGDR